MSVNRKNRDKSLVLFVHPKPSRFVQNDIAILKKHFDIRTYHYRATKNILEQFIDQFCLFVWLSLFIVKTRHIFIWFADYHSFLPVLFARIFRKKSFLVIGGYDVAHIPELGYGSFKNKFRATVTTFSIRNATTVLPVVETLMYEALSRVPDAHLKVVYTGFDFHKFIHKGSQKESLILTVAAGNTFQRIKLKGIDFFVKLARILPQYQFTVVGLNGRAIECLGELPANITIFDHVDDSILLNLYQRSKIYVQFSLREGLPSAVCEAMLCECIPIGSRKGGIPIAIGECGFLIDNHDVDAACTAINKAMKMGPKLGRSARQRVIDNFSMQRREEVLIDLLSEEISLNIE